MLAACLASAGSASRHSVRKLLQEFAPPEAQVSRLPVTCPSGIERRDRLGGLIHEYDLAA